MTEMETIVSKVHQQEVDAYAELLTILSEEEKRKNNDDD